MPQAEEREGLQREAAFRVDRVASALAPAAAPDASLILRAPIKGPDGEPLPSASLSALWRPLVVSPR